MSKYNLGLGVFIAVIASTSYLFGFFSAAYVGELNDNKKSEYLGKMVSQYEEMINFAKDNEMFETYQFYYNEKVFLERLMKLDKPPLQLIAKKKKVLKEAIPSLECMLSKFTDPEMKKTAIKRINETKLLINEST